MNEVHHSTRQVFQFLKWKLRYYPNGLTENDVQIIQSTHLVEFFSLSPKACKYTKDIMNKYQEFIWHKIIQNELQLNEYETPVPKCHPLTIKQEFTREQEVLAMSMLYPNNLLNSFLYRFDRDKFPTPLCSCEEEEQTAHHVLFKCNHSDPHLREELFNMLKQTVGEEVASIESSAVLLKASITNLHFFRKVCEATRHQFHHIRTNVQL